MNTEIAKLVTQLTCCVYNQNFQEQVIMLHCNSAALTTYFLCSFKKNELERAIV